MITEYEDLCVDIIQWTQRPTSKLIEKAAKLACPEEAPMFRLRGQQIHNATHWAKVKSRFIQDGQKIKSPATLRLAQMIKKLSPESKLKGSLILSTKRLMLRKSEEASPKRSLTAERVSRKSPGQSPRKSLRQSPRKTRASLPVSTTSLKDDIFSSYGLAKKTKTCEEDDVIFLSQQTIDSSSDNDVSPYKEANATQGKSSSSSSDNAIGKSYHQYFDWAELASVRAYKNGELEIGDMQPGPDGFAMCSFPNEEPQKTDHKSHAFH